MTSAASEGRQFLKTRNPTKPGVVRGRAVASLVDVGAVIRSTRKAQAIRIDDAAALCGVSVDLLSRLENGKTGVSSERVLRVLDGLGLRLLVVDKSQAVAALEAIATDVQP